MTLLELALDLKLVGLGLLELGACVLLPPLTVGEGELIGGA